MGSLAIFANYCLAFMCHIYAVCLCDYCNRGHIQYGLCCVGCGTIWHQINMQNATESSMQLLKTISDMGVLSMAAAGSSI